MCFPFPAGLRGRTGPSLCKNAPVHNGEVGPRRGKNLPRLPGCPAIAPGGLGKPLGFGFSCNLEHKTLLPPFAKEVGVLYSHPIRDWGERTEPPRCKNAPVHNGRVGPCRGKIFRAFQIVPPSLRAVWESPWGLNFHEIRNIKHCSHLFSSVGTFVFPIPSGIGGRTGPPLCKNALVHNGRAGPCQGKNLPHFPDCPAITPGGLGKLLGLGFLMQSGM